MTEHLGWHWLKNDRTLAYGDDRRVLRKGSVRHFDGELALCRQGLHWSETPLEALRYAPGSIICRVKAWGDTVTGNDKATSQYRKVLWWVNVEYVLWTWLCDISENALLLTKVSDQRSWNAITLRRSWLGGAIVTGQEWNSTWIAASDAAWNIVRAVASAAAKEAKWDAARVAMMLADNAAVWEVAVFSMSAHVNFLGSQLEAMVRNEARRKGIKEWKI